MNIEHYRTNLNLEINNKIARLVSKIDDDISEIWKIEKKEILNAIHFKEQLIEYLENKIEYYSNLDSVNCNIRSDVYQEILEKVRSVKY